MRILVTRPEREGRATVARLAELGHEGVLEPVTRIVALPDVELPRDGLQAVTATSLNAVEVLAGRDDLGLLSQLPFFAVGDRTARAARDVGFSDVRSAGGDRRDLVKVLSAALDPRKGAIVWLVGHDRAGDLVADLAPPGFTVTAVEVYRAEPIAALGEATAEALRAGEIDAALVFSPRGAMILLEKLADCGFSPSSLDFPVHVISEATAQPFRAAGWRRIVVASSPDTDAMLATLGHAPPSADPVGRQIRSSTMRPKSRKDTSSETGREAVESPAEVVETATAPIDPVVETAEAPATEAEAPDVAAGEVVESPKPVTELEAEPMTEPVEVSAEPAEPVEMREPTPAATPTPTPTPAPAPLPAAQAKGFGIGGLLVAVLLGGAAGVGGTWGLASKGLLPDGGDGRIAALEATIAEMKATKPAPAGDGEITGRLAALEKTVVAGVTTAAAPDLSGIEARVAKLETIPTGDLAALEGRLAALEAKPATPVPSDLAERLAGLEAAAKARLDSARTSIAEALSSLPADGAPKEALDRVAGQVDQALGALREKAGAEIAALAARIDRLGGGLDAENKALAEKFATETRALGERLAAMASAAVEELKKRNDDLSKGLADKLGAATATIEAERAAREEEIAKAFDGLRQRLQAMEGLRAEIDAALGRVGSLETATREVGSNGQKLVEKVGEATAAAETKVGALSNRLDGIEAEAAAARKAQAGAVMVMALADLKSAVDAGRPFAGEIGVAKSVAKGAVDLSALEPFAAKGVPSVASLREDWPAVLRAMTEAAERKTAGPGIFDRLLSHATNVVKVRPAGEKAGDDLAALASRVEARLAAGDLPAALAAWKALPEDARAVSATWGGALEARVGIDRTLAAQTAAVVSTLTQQSQ